MRLSRVAITLKLTAAAIIALSCQLATAQVQLFEHDNFQGRSFATGGSAADLYREGFNDRASSVIVLQGRWQLCSDVNFSGRCVTLDRGEYRSLAAIGLNDQVSSVRGHGWNNDFHGGSGGGSVVLYEDDNFRGHHVDADSSIGDLQRQGFNDRASSIVIRRGQWQFCSDGDFRGQCVNLGPGNYPSLSVLGMNDRISSLRANSGQWMGDGGQQAGNNHGGLALYENDDFSGRQLTVRGDLPALDREGFNDRASSVVIQSGTWLLCSDTEFRGRCVTLDRGRFSSLASMGLNDRISSVRRVR